MGLIISNISDVFLLSRTHAPPPARMVARRAANMRNPHANCETISMGIDEHTKSAGVFPVGGLVCQCKAATLTL